MENIPYFQHDARQPAYVGHALAQASIASGAPLAVVVERNFLEFDSDLQLAAGPVPLHTLRYSHALRPYHTHFLVSAATKVHRIFTLPAAERLVPGTPADSVLPQRYHDELQRKLHWSLSAAGVAQHARFLRTGLMRQLTSFPLDQRVESDLHCALPEHRPLQNAYLAFQVRDILPTFDDEVRRYVPDDLYEASTALSIAFAEHAASIAGVVPDPVVRSHASRHVAERLLEHLNKVELAGYTGDRELTDRWADELGLRDWYDWVPLPPLHR